QTLLNGVLYIVLDIARFRPLLEFMDDGASLYGKAKTIPAVNKRHEVYLPGEPERETEKRRRAAGIPLDANAWDDIAAAANRLNVSVPTV
ncbi:MAG: Ldh family oxidoreductase, partial [Chloroflexota bacterium]